MTSHNRTTALSQLATASAVAVGEPLARSDRAKTLPKIKALISRRARQAAGCSSAVQLALKIDVRPWLVKRHESAAFDNAPTIEHMLTGPRAYALSLVTQVAEQHGATVHPLPTVQHPDHATRLAAVTREACTLLTAYTEALRDGCVDAREREELLREARELKAACLEIEAAVLASGRDGL